MRNLISNGKTDSSSEISISISTANLVSVLMLIPFGLLYLIPYAFIWGKDALDLSNVLFTWVLKNGKDHPRMALLLFWTYFFFWVVLGILLHEILHALTWALFCKKGLKAVAIGFNINTFTPFAHCKEPLLMWQYRLGTLTPGLLTGLVPALSGIIFQNIFLTIYGLFFTVAASGDFIMLWESRKINKYHQVKDHPNKIGLIL